jgi:ATP-dependent Clp protease ATP-binding subunit ClpA
MKMMKTRLTPAARSAVVRAYEFAAQGRAAEIREEHLLKAVLADVDGRRLLGGQTLDADALHQVSADLAERRRRAGLTGAEQSALAGFGIDLDELVQQVEERLGANALAGAERKRPPWWRKPVFSAECLRVLAAAERHLPAGAAVPTGVGGRSLGIEHLSLALVTMSTALSESLARHGINEATVRAAVISGAAQR